MLASGQQPLSVKLIENICSASDVALAVLVTGKHQPDLKYTYTVSDLTPTMMSETVNVPFILPLLPRCLWEGCFSNS